jgi:hypothetical protein
MDVSAITCAASCGGDAVESSGQMRHNAEEDLQRVFRALGHSEEDLPKLMATFYSASYEERAEMLKEYQDQHGGIDAPQLAGLLLQQPQPGQGTLVSPSSAPLTGGEFVTVDQAALPTGQTGAAAGALPSNADVVLKQPEPEPGCVETKNDKLATLS